jgi:hypothetical protein
MAQQQLTFVDVEPAMEMVQMAEEMLKNYGWMIKEVVRLKECLQDAGEGTVASYGDSNAGIRAQYKNRDKTGSEVTRRDRKWQRYEQMKKKISLLDAAMATIIDDQELLVLDLLIEGKTMLMVAAVMEVSRQRAHRV